MNPARHSILRAAVAFALPIAVFTAVVPARLVHANSEDKKQPINYSANSADVNQNTKGGSLSGNVVITQGTMTIRADRIVFKQNPDSSVSATAYGNPITFRQKREGVDEYFEGYAQRAEYDGEKSLLELFDRALLKRGQDEIRSNYISYNTRTELFRAEGRPDAAGTPQDAGPGARVRGVFQPKGEGKDEAKSNGNTGDKSGDKAAPLPLKRAGELKSGAAK